jgi:hypothetical protein
MPAALRQKNGGSGRSLTARFGVARCARASSWGFQFLYDLYRDRAFEAFDDFGDSVESLSYGAKKPVKFVVRIHAGTDTGRLCVEQRVRPPVVSAVVLSLLRIRARG